MASEFEQIASLHKIQVGKERIDRLRVWYYEPPNQSEKTLVLIPGFNSLTSAWDKFLMKMKDNYRIYIIETREKFTADVRLSSDFTAERFARDIAEIIEYMMIEDYILVASSMGAAFVFRAMSMGLIDPIHSFIVGPVLKPKIPRFAWFFAYISNPLVWHGFIKPVTKLYLRLHYEEPEQITKYHEYLDKIKPRRVRKSMLSLRKFAITTEELQEIDSHIILLGAEKDKLHTAEQTKEIGSQLPNSQYFDLGTNIAAHSEPLANLIMTEFSE